MRGHSSESERPVVMPVDDHSRGKHKEEISWLAQNPREAESLVAWLGSMGVRARVLDQETWYDLPLVLPMDHTLGD